MWANLIGFCLLMDDVDICLFASDERALYSNIKGGYNKKDNEWRILGLIQWELVNFGLDYMKIKKSCMNIYFVIDVYRLNELLKFILIQFIYLSLSYFYRLELCASSLEVKFSILQIYWHYRVITIYLKQRLTWRHR